MLAHLLFHRGAGREEYHRALRCALYPRRDQENKVTQAAIGPQKIILVCQAAFWCSDRNTSRQEHSSCKRPRNGLAYMFYCSLPQWWPKILTSRSAASSSAHYHIACPMSQSRTKVQITDAKTATAITISGQSNVWKLATARVASE